VTAEHDRRAGEAAAGWLHGAPSGPLAGQAELPGIDAIEAAQAASLAQAALQHATERFVLAQLRADRARAAAGTAAPAPVIRDYQVTFYPRQDRHPRFSLAAGDGWVTIEALDYDDARQLAVQLLGTAWCDCYSPSSWADARAAYPAGATALARFTTLAAALVRQEAGQ